MSDPPRVGHLRLWQWSAVLLYGRTYAMRDVRPARIAAALTVLAPQRGKFTTAAA